MSRYCNGIKLDPCLTEAPELGTNYYYPDPMHVDYYNSKPWAGDADDIYWLELGFAYGSSESAAKHGHAMGITKNGFFSPSGWKPEAKHFVKLLIKQWVLKIQLLRMERMNKDKALTIQQVADILGVHYNTIYSKRHELGFRLPNSRIWRIWQSTLDNLGKKRNNVISLSLHAKDDKEIKQCQSTNVQTPNIGRLISPVQAEKELDALLKL